ncbi:MAG TPA: hypothetical protein VKN99_26390 [Polyangia bacterium]|nr:hypothetical protein [Polyangia bacterium]
MSEARYRGFDFLSVRKFVRTTYGEDALRALADHLAPRGYAGVVTDVIYPEDWRTLAEFDALCVALDELFWKPGTERPSVRQGRYTCEDQLKWVHRVAMRLLRPSWLIENGVALWDKYCDVGKWEVRWPRPNQAGAILTEMPLMSESFCVSLVGWFERFYQLCGCRAVRVVHTSCRSRGDEVCRWDGSWQ